MHFETCVIWLGLNHLKLHGQDVRKKMVDTYITAHSQPPPIPIQTNLDWGRSEQKSFVYFVLLVTSLDKYNLGTFG